MFHKQAWAQNSLVFGGTAFALVSLVFSLYFGYTLSFDQVFLIIFTICLMSGAMWLFEMGIPYYIRTSGIMQEKKDVAWYAKMVLLWVMWGFCASFSFMSSWYTTATLTHDSELVLMQESVVYQESLTDRAKAAERARNNAVSEAEIYAAQVELKRLEASKQSFSNGTVQSGNGSNVSVSFALKECRSNSGSFYQSVCDRYDSIDTEISRQQATINRYSEYRSSLAHLEYLKNQPLPDGAKSSNLAGFEGISQLVDAEYGVVKMIILSLLSFATVILPFMAVTLLGKELGCNVEIEAAVIPAQSQRKTEATQNTAFNVEVAATGPMFKRVNNNVQTLHAHQLRMQHDMAEIKRTLDAVATQPTKQPQKRQTVKRLLRVPTGIQNAQHDQEIYDKLLPLVQGGKIKPTKHGLRQAIKLKTGVEMNNVRAKRIQNMLVSNKIIKRAGKNGRGDIFELVI